MADFSPGYPITGSLERDRGFAQADSGFATADERLAEALRDGSEEAFEALIQQFQHPVHNLVYRLLDDPGEAPDVLQEVFLKVFRKISLFRHQSSLKTWIYRIAVNEAYNHRRSFGRHRRQQVGLDAPIDEGLSYQDVLADPSESPFDVVASRETQQRIEAALLEINPVFRAAVILRDLEELSYEEIADVLQVNLGTVKSRILRGREALRRVLAESPGQPLTGALRRA